MIPILIDSLLYHFLSAIWMYALLYFTLIFQCGHPEKLQQNTLNLCNRLHTLITDESRYILNFLMQLLSV